MTPLFNCELFYFDSPHLHQLYDGFEKLKKNGLIDLTITKATIEIGNYRKPLLTVIVDKKFKIIYDTLDGFNWFDGAEEDNLEFFRNNISADFYFKRSYKEIIQNYAPVGCRIYPLGFNYQLKPEGTFQFTLKQKLRDILQNTPFSSGVFRKNQFYSQYFENYPVPNKEIKILFLARLWSPFEVEGNFLKEERYMLNSSRIACIRACQKEFKGRFSGGLKNTEYTREIAEDLIVSTTITNKKSYLRTVKNCDICIATTGLFDSIGWKFGEYVAASRAIVSEPLLYQVPGEFTEGKNYLSFSDSDQLIQQIYSLLDNREYLRQMMLNNFHYYNNFLRPDSLILNTLLKVKSLTQ